MASQTHLNRVLGYIDIARRSDARLITGGGRPTDGLAGSVWTADEARGIALATRVRAGTLGVNYYRIDRGTPFGGFKNSGIGREYGPEGLANYLEYQSVYASAAQPNH
jgi:aldehyde dehydrogenase (NAD+)